MSLNRFSRGAVRIAQLIVSRVENLNGTWVVRSLPQALKQILPRTAVPQAAARVALPRAPSKNPLIRLIQLTIRHQRLIARPFSTLLMNHRAFAANQRFRIHRPKLLFKQPRRNDGIIERIKDIFGTKERYNEHLGLKALPDRLDAYDIGGNIGYGCNAAVYALKLREERPDIRVRDNRDLKAYPLALKLMYNYELDRTSEEGLWRGMGAELAPLPKATKLLKGRIANFRPLPCTHPNIVHVSTAFVDALPLLPDARERYPEALPSAPFYSMIVDEPKTLFIVMKRYRMTLRDYVLTNRRNFWTCRVLTAQLLEGCVFLHNHKVAQRDMKSDNILLSFDMPGEIPYLVISDFGCALANGSFLLEYRDDTTDLGGNLATRAPEIATAVPPCTLDYSLADTWAAGTLAYEIYTRMNPFYSSLKSRSYTEAQLPVLSPMIPAPVRRTIHAILRRDPEERVRPAIAANVISLSLFRLGNDIRELFRGFGLHPIGSQLRKVSERVERTLDGVLSALAAETVVARVAHRQLISKAELQLRATFMSRLSRDELWESLAFFEASPMESETESEMSDAV